MINRRQKQKEKLNKEDSISKALLVLKYVFEEDKIILLPDLFLFFFKCLTNLDNETINKHKAKFPVEFSDEDLMKADKKLETFADKYQRWNFACRCLGLPPTADSKLFYDISGIEQNARSKKGSITLSEQEFDNIFSEINLDEDSKDAIDNNYAKNREARMARLEAMQKHFAKICIVNLH